MTGRDLIRIPALAAMISIALAAPAAAQNATASAYGGVQTEVIGNFPAGGGQSEVLGNFAGDGKQDVVPGPAPAAPAAGEAPAATPVERGVDTPVVTTPTVATGELPFTGFEAGLVALAGLVLLGSGFAMRRAASRSIA